MPYAVQTPVFEGPFDLLLHLILRDEVDIYELSISAIVDAYLHELEHMEELDLEIATEFLLIAATLVELKVKRLLPDESDVELDDEFGLWEERDLLLARLLECKTFKDAARHLERMSERAARCYPRRAGLEDRFFDLAPDILEGVDADDIKAAFIRALTPKPKPKVDLFHVSAVRVSVAEAVEELVDELPRVGRITFHELTSSFVERLEVVVRFLAVLELFKQGLIDIDQPANFGQIEIVWIGGRVAGIAAELADLDTVDAYDG
ncbi:MAG: segregation/condensation protein A [Actinobacteria bacterium]|nr:segregation/condensation protein A [Actinomycetota bacterium]